MTDSREENPQDHLMDRLLSATTLPDVVYHYTDTRGFLGILDSQSFWLSEVRYLNDTEEFKYTLTLAERHLDALLRTVTADQERLLVAQWQASLTTAAQTPVYVGCFSEKPDDLSQWRAYGRGSGFAIGVRPILLMQATLTFPHPGAWLKCVYNPDDQEAFLDYATTYLLAHFRSRALPAPPDDLTYRVGFEIHFLGHLLALAACFKHPAFADEAEWRLVFRQPPGLRDVAHRKFRHAGRLLVPYLDVPIQIDNRLIRIDQVIVGPTPHMDLTLAAVRSFLAQHNVANDGVIPSVVPFRDW